MMRHVDRLLFLGLFGLLGCSSGNGNDTIPQTNQAVQRPKVGNTTIVEMPQQNQPPPSYPSGAAPQAPPREDTTPK
jgi:hypothetical protein